MKGLDPKPLGNEGVRPQTLGKWRVWTPERESWNTLCHPKVPKTAPWTRCAKLIVTRRNSAGRQEPFSKQDFSQSDASSRKPFLDILSSFVLFWSLECHFGSLRPIKAPFKANFDQPGGKKALGQDLAPDPVKRAFFSIEITSVLVPWNFGFL